MSAQFPFVSIVIPVYNGWEFLTPCLNAILAQQYPADRFEVVVVFNDNSYSEPIISPSIRYLSEPNPGAYCARNLGVKTAKGDLFAFLDVDCIPDTAWLLNGVQALVQHPGCGFVGGRIQIVPSPTTGCRLSEFYERAVYFRQETYVRQYQFAATGNMFTTRATFERIGLFNDRLKSGGDAEWGWRARDFGLAGVYEPKAIVKHRSKTLWQLLRKSRRVAGGILERQRLVSCIQSGSRGTQILVYHWRDELRIFHRDLDLITQSNTTGFPQMLSLKILAVLIFVIRVAERWRIVLGGSSVRG